MSPLLAGRRLAVTGGANGIGAAVVRRSTELGARCVVLDLPGTDVTDEGSVRDALAAAAAELDGLDGVVAAAGIVPSWQRPAELDLGDLDRVLAVNVRGVAATIKHALAHLGPESTIVAVASLNSWRGDPNIAAYAASKHAVLGLVRSAAMALGSSGIRVNAVAPGPVATDALRARMAARAGATGLDVDAALAAAAHGTALGRLASPDDVADAVAFLTGPTSRSITGQLLAVDGGIL